MDKFFIDFYIRGKVPGTELQVEFWHVVTCIVAGVIIFEVLFSRKFLRRSRQKIDPYFGAPKDMSEIDLVAL